MMSQENNEELTRVGPGTPMGNVLRHYWYPVALTRELEEFPVKKTRLLGEDFAVYKRPDGQYAIVAERCPHRGASLAYGMVEANGLRCAYHGWLFDIKGKVLEQPAEPNANFREKVCAKVGRAQELGGLIWAYIGKDPAPELPRYAGYVMKGVRDIGHTILPCNWLQIMENSVDPYHVEWLHGRYFAFLAQKKGFVAPSSFQKEHLKVAFDVFEHGIIKRRLLKGQPEDSDDWKIGHPLVFPYKMWVGGNGIYQMQIRVPIDDTHTWVMFYSVHAPDGVPVPEHPKTVDYPIEWKDAAGNMITDYVEGQDMMAWVSQGAIADRTNEFLGQSDAGVIRLRRMFKDALDAVAEGKDPPAVQRTRQESIDLPLERSKFSAGPEFALQWLAGGSMRYSPQNEELRQLHIAAARARGEHVDAA